MTAGHTKTERKDPEGRVIYTSVKTGEDRVRCKSKTTGKAEWRKVAVATKGKGKGKARMGGGYPEYPGVELEFFGIEKVKKDLAELTEKVDKMSKQLNRLNALERNVRIERNLPPLNTREPLFGDYGKYNPKENKYNSLNTNSYHHPD